MLMSLLILNYDYLFPSNSGLSFGHYAFHQLAVVTMVVVDAKKQKSYQLFKMTDESRLGIGPR